MRGGVVLPDAEFFVGSSGELVTIERFGPLEPEFIHEVLAAVFGRKTKVSAGG